MKTPCIKTKFLLVRHATCSHLEDTLLGRALDVPLDARGRAQARALAARLRGEAPTRVECSPRLRTRQTARAIARGVGCRVKVAAALDEMDFGDWAGRTFAQLVDNRAWHRWNFDREHARTPAGDDMASVQRRVGEYLAALARRYANATLVLVTHAEVIRVIALHCLGRPARDYAHITIAPASITRLCADADGMRVEAVNEPVQP